MPMCIWTARAPVRNFNKVLWLCVSICQCFVFERRGGVESIVKFDSSCSSTLQPELLARSRQICSIAFDIVGTWILQGLAPGIPLLETHRTASFSCLFAFPSGKVLPGLTKWSLRKLLRVPRVDVQKIRSGREAHPTSVQKGHASPFFGTPKFEDMGIESVVACDH